MVGASLPLAVRDLATRMARAQETAPAGRSMAFGSRLQLTSLEPPSFP